MMMLEKMRRKKELKDKATAESNNDMDSRHASGHLRNRPSGVNLRKPSSNRVDDYTQQKGS